MLSFVDTILWIRSTCYTQSIEDGTLDLSFGPLPYTTNQGSLSSHTFTKFWNINSR